MNCLLLEIRWVILVMLKTFILVSIFLSFLAWNLAVQFKACPEKMRDFFLLSFKVRTLANLIEEYCRLLSSVRSYIDVSGISLGHFCLKEIDLQYKT